VSDLMADRAKPGAHESLYETRGGSHVAGYINFVDASWEVSVASSVVSSWIGDDGGAWDDIKVLGAVALFATCTAAAGGSTTTACATGT